jgi:thioredoxin 1
MGDSRVVAVNEDSFDYLVLESTQPVLVEFWAPWCDSCARQTPVLEELAEEAGERFSIAMVNADDNPELLYRLKVSGIPTMKLFRGGQEIKSLAGLRTKEQILKLLFP